MKYLFFFILAVLLALGVQANAPAQISSVDFPEVPRVSAYEAYGKYKAGKAIIVHAGGEAYSGRHISGALNVDQEAIVRGETKLPNFPKRGIEIFTYCY